MKAKVFQGKANGEVLAPPSKSMAHRMLMGAGLASGTSTIGNIELSEDIKATLGILEALGCEVSMKGHTVTLTGIGNSRPISDMPLNCNESGSTLRFFIPLLLSGGETCEFVGAKRLFERPLNIYEDICKTQGILYEKSESGLKLSGELKADHFKIPGDISSQFITGLLFALPRLEQSSVLELIPPVESKAYIDMTLETLEQYGIQIKKEGNLFFIPGNQVYHPVKTVVEGDYSNAAFLDALRLLGGDVSVTGLRKDSLQGDHVYQEDFKLLQEGKATIDISECPDLGPILIGMAAALHGARFTGTRRLKIKESDRGSVMAMELRKFGIQVDVFENEIVVQPGELKKPTETLDSHNDHRIAMTLTTLCTLTDGTIRGCEAVRKSFPGYYDTIRKLGIQVEIEE